MPGPRSRWTDAQLAQIAADDPGTELYAATSTLAAMEELRPLNECIVDEGAVLSALGVHAGSDVLDAIEANVPARVVRLIQGDGVDICDPQTALMLDQLVSAGALTDAQRQSLLALGMQQVPTWPGIRAADLELARKEYGGV